MTLGDLYRADTDEVVGMLGKVGRMILDRVRGLEDGAIDPDDEAAVAAAREAVEAAREEYDRLTAAQKALVENAGALT